MSIVVNKTRLPVTEWQTASGSVVSINNARRRDAKSAVVTLQPIQDLSHGDPSPTNLCPISGRSSVTAVRDGKNLLDTTLYVGCAYNPTVGAVFNTALNATQFTVNADRTEFTIETSATWKYYCLLFPLIDGQNFRRSFTFVRGTDSGQIGSTEGYLDSEYKVLTKFNKTNTTQAFDGTLNPPTGAKYYYVVLTNRGTASQKLILQNPQIEIGTVTSSYEPYQGISVTLSLGQTVYGGTVDLVSGVGTVIWTDIDMGTMKWERYGDKFYSTSIRSVIHKGSASYGYGNILSSQYKNVSKSSLVQLNDGEISVDSGGNIQLCDNRFSDSASLKTALDGVQLVYPLATPQTIQLTANQIEMLMRNNTVWSDAGVVTLNYARIHS